jgi:hypothetical protein
MLIKDIKYWAWLIQNICLVSLEGRLTPRVYLPGKSIPEVYQEWLEKKVCLNNALQFHTHHVPCIVQPRKRDICRKQVL